MGVDHTPHSPDKQAAILTRGGGGAPGNALRSGDKNIWGSTFF